ncbi:hypothetical protein WJX72_006606 [[Myrmecia] bisecta]|uniref:ARID domain-containing protein n=1 Tax=[Myrmecia] bisecta TaxID=41462 RepID=A0AAW1PWG5_9CHLO
MTSTDRRGYTLQPLVAAGILEAGPDRLSCSVGGTEFFAELGSQGEIVFEGTTFRSPSAFSVFVKRKVNPTRKADDGWTSVKYDGDQLGKDEVLMAESSPDQAAWIQCEVPDCLKWRNVHKKDVPDGHFQCSMNPDPRFNSCDKEQQFTDAEIDRLMEDEVNRRHRANCMRPPLSQCTESQFERDLLMYLEGRGEGNLAKLLREKRVTCNNTPIDIFGLYREVTRNGGFLANERYDAYGRWVGGINFAGQIFPKMRNYTQNHRATSIGNQLLSNYRKFLVAYEVCHQHKDLDSLQPGSKAVSETQGASDALAFLADVASADVGADDEPAPKVTRGPRSKQVRTTGKRSVLEPGEELPVEQRKRQRLPEPDVRSGSAARTVTVLRKAEHAAGRHPPGALLLAQDPRDLNRHWPVVVASMNDLPREVASGGTCALCEGTSFPLPLAEASTTGRPDDAYPVLIIGTQSLGWVEAGSCRPYSQSAGEAAMVAVMPAFNRGRQAGSAPMQDDPTNTACSRALKLASQYNRAGDGHHCNMARSMAHTAGLRYVIGRLLELEGRLPEDALCCTSFQFWQSWRRSVERAESAAEITPQILALAHQLGPDVWRRGAADALWEELRYLLDMQPNEAPSLDAKSATHKPSIGPTVLGADDAVTAMESAVDWMRLHKLWLPGVPMPASSFPTTSSRGGQPGNGLKSERLHIKHSSSVTELAPRAEYAQRGQRSQHTRQPSPLQNGITFAAGEAVAEAALAGMDQDQAQLPAQAEYQDQAEAGYAEAAAPDVAGGEAEVQQPTPSMQSGHVAPPGLLADQEVSNVRGAEAMEISGSAAPVVKQGNSDGQHSATSQQGAVAQHSAG